RSRATQVTVSHSPSTTLITNVIPSASAKVVIASSPLAPSRAEHQAALRALLFGAPTSARPAERFVDGFRCGDRSAPAPLACARATPAAPPSTPARQLR